MPNEGRTLTSKRTNLSRLVAKGGPARTRCLSSSAKNEVFGLFFGLGVERNDPRRRGDGRLRRVLANQNDVALPNAIHSPVELVLWAVGATDVHDLGAADERALVDDGAFAARVDEHRARPIASENDGDELQLVDRVLTELDLALVDRLARRLRILSDEAPERVSVAVAFDEVVLGVVGPFELGRQRRSRGGSQGSGATRRGRRRWRGAASDRPAQREKGQVEAKGSPDHRDPFAADLGASA